MVLNGKRQSDLIRICQELIRRPSPSGKEREVATFIADTMRSIGYDEVSIDLYGNVIGRQFFATPGKRLLLESQMDHIDPGTLTDWSYYPYGAFIKDGCIYGRGASDQKGCLAAMILAGAELKNNFYNKLKGELVVAGTVFQERFEGVASRTVASAFPPDFVVLGEATELKIKRGQRGRAEIVIETQGRMTHSSNPEFGSNAADAMISILSSIHQSYSPSFKPFFGENILVLTTLRTYPDLGTGLVPEICRAIFDLRVFPDDTPESVVRKFKGLIERAKDSLRGIKVKIFISETEDRTYTGASIRGTHFARAWALPEESDYLKRALRAVETLGMEGGVSDSPGFGTNGCYYAGELGIPTIVFGPSGRRLVHSIDEYIEINDLFLAFQGYEGIAKEVLT